MDFWDPQWDPQLAEWLSTKGYVWMFFVMILGGPAVTSAAAFGAALNYFDLWFVFLFPSPRALPPTRFII